MHLSNLLFDLDGTLTDPKPGISRCIQHALTELGA
jgi:phosphoglycolate phosphatase